MVATKHNCEAYGIGTVTRFKSFPEDVAEKILSIPLAETPHEDFQVWSVETTGEFTTRSAYKLLQSIENNPEAYALQNDYKDFYRKLWLLDLPSKIKITVWKISWNFLATRANMLLRRLTNTSVCPRCSSGTETMDHLFRECPAGFSHKARLLSIESFVLQYGPSVKIWTKPVDKVVKINFDAAYDGRQSKAAIGVVARDKEGSVLLSCTEVHQRVPSAFGAEAIACRKALQVGVNMQWEKVIIEGDSLSIIRKCKTKSPNKSLISAYLHDIHQLLLKFKECRFEHIPRLANNLAHILANEALKSRRGAYLIGRVPEAAEIQAETERAKEPD